jgi:ABC-type antimicrobial peptide transport system permease subunit
MFGPILIIGFLFVFFVVAIMFSGQIFGNTEAAMNVTNMSNESRDAYNATTGLVQTGMTIFDVMAILVVLAGVIFGVFLVYRAMR